MHITRKIRVKSYNESIQHGYQTCHRIVSYTQSIQYGYRTSSHGILIMYSVLLYLTTIHPLTHITCYIVPPPHPTWILSCYTPPPYTVLKKPTTMTTRIWKENRRKIHWNLIRRLVLYWSRAQFGLSSSIFSPILLLLPYLSPTPVVAVTNIPKLVPPLAVTVFSAGQLSPHAIFFAILLT